MDIRGFDRFSLVDYPGHISCIVFTGGCNYRCPFCHNACLVLDPASQPRVTEHEFFHFLDSRKGLLEGVVVSGGEPTLQPDLADFLTTIRERGMLVKLDTNGSHPEVVKKLIEANCVSEFGIDYKAPVAGYAEATRCREGEGAEAVRASIRAVLDSGVALEVRTTVHRALLSPEELSAMRDELRELGVPRWILQQFNPTEVLASGLENRPTYGDHELAHIAHDLGPMVAVRGLHGAELFVDPRRQGEN